MRNYQLAIFLCAILLFQTAFSISQETESYLEALQRNLMDSFVGPMKAKGETITQELRAQFVGYILGRQNHYIGAFEEDKINFNKLKAEVREFINSISEGQEQNLWNHVEEGASGKLDVWIEQKLGGSPYVMPMFKSLEDTTDKWRDVSYSAGNLQNSGHRDEVMKCFNSFISHLRENDYDSALEYCAGKAKEEIGAWNYNTRQEPEERSRYSDYFRSIEFKNGTMTMSSTEPPMVKMEFEYLALNGEWENDPVMFILDNGKWKIFRFLD